MIKLVFTLCLFVTSYCSKLSRLDEKKLAANTVESRLAMDEMMEESNKVQRQRNLDSTQLDSAQPFTCSYMKMDIQTVVDWSGSVTEKNFNTLHKLIVQDLIGDLVVSPTAAVVSNLNYAEGAVLMPNSNSEFRIPWKYRGGRRFTGLAMDIAYQNFRQFMRTSPDVLRALIFFTNGETDKDDPRKTEKWSLRWNRRLGAKVFAVGIGNNISQKGLKSIAGSYGRTLRINSYGQEDIKDVLYYIKHVLCNTPIDFQTNFKIRLADGTDTTGRVEILYGHWGTICIDGGRKRIQRRLKFSRVVCRQLGLGRGSVAVSDPPFKQGPGRILLDHIDCRGSETNIGQCRRRSAHGVHRADHCPDGVIAGVRCSPRTN